MSNSETTASPATPERYDPVVFRIFVRSLWEAQTSFRLDWDSNFPRWLGEIRKWLDEPVFKAYLSSDPSFVAYLPSRAVESRIEHALHSLLMRSLSDDVFHRLGGMHATAPMLYKGILAYFEPVKYRHLYKLAAPWASQVTRPNANLATVAEAIHEIDCIIREHSPNIETPKYLIQLAFLLVGEVDHDTVKDAEDGKFNSLYDVVRYCADTRGMNSQKPGEVPAYMAYRTCSEGRPGRSKSNCRNRKYKVGKKTSSRPERCGGCGGIGHSYKMCTSLN